MAQRDKLDVSRQVKPPVRQILAEQRSERQDGAPPSQRCRLPRRLRRWVPWLPISIFLKNSQTRKSPRCETLSIRMACCCFRDQDITPEAHVAFSKRFGPPRASRPQGRAARRPPGDLHSFEPQEERGNAWAALEPATTGTPISPTWPNHRSALLLRSIEVPEVGGDTMFANLAVAYDALSDTMKSFLEGLEVEHSFENVLNRVVKLGLNKPFTKEQLKATPPAGRPTDDSNPP